MTSKESSNDCLAHSLNFALRYPWFTCREQLLRLVQLRRKETLEVAKRMKIDGGIPLSVMKDIAVVNGESISLKKFDRLELFQNGKGCSALMKIVNERFFQKQDLKELIVVGRAQGIAIPYTHCITLVKVGDSIALCDCS